MPEMRAIQLKTTVLNQDSLSAISRTEEVQSLRKVRHRGVKYHYVPDAINTSVIAVPHVASTENRGGDFDERAYWG